MDTIISSNCHDCGGKPISTLILRVFDGHMSINTACKKCASENFMPDSLGESHGLLRLPIPEQYIKLAQNHER